MTMITNAPRIARDLVYATHSGTRMVLDVFQPSGSGTARPAIIMIHGGRWKRLDKLQYQGEATSLAMSGYVVFLINYRVEGQPSFPALLDNVQSAMRWAAEHAAEFGVDPDRIAMFGGSAGGHLSALSAVLSRVEPGLPKVRVAVSWSGFYDLIAAYEETAANPRGAEPRGALENAFDGTPATCRDRYIQLSPITHLRADSPPLFIGISSDEVAPLGQAQRMIARMRELNVPCEIQVIEGDLHNRELGPLVWTQTLDFLRKYV